jgi:hypothetical protein
LVWFLLAFIAFGSGLGPEGVCRRVGRLARGGIGGIGGVELAVGVLEDKDIEWVESMVIRLNILR